MNLILCPKISQAQKNKYHMFSYVEVKKVTLTEVEGRMIETRGWAGYVCVVVGSCLMGTNIQLDRRNKF